MAKPSTVPVWNDDGSNNVEPSSGQKTTGWVPGQQPPAQTFNWWQRLVYQWILWLNAFENEIHTWTVLQNFVSATFAATPSTGSQVVRIENVGGAGGTSALTVTSNANGPTARFISTEATSGNPAIRADAAKGASIVANTGAIRFAVVTTLPTSPAVGDVVFYQAVGANTLYCWNGTAWSPLS